ncbi:LLM class flavin-dependent oxidoreductase [Brachybacterium avium]|uniref:LLM class flavin-dependent oxidoreductase n=1 Tax=Brachybacterium avium TaxID=2017485 RepID=A0A220UE68_9MICO|nr:MsnO8 family LLM class oxidoreductase [Brachybacterium avium]ASK66395.1 LLM class flavin-dependent oxidoreductase [Brachybacterium avium]
MRLSLLDRSRTRHGYSEATALAHSVQRAIDVEHLGYHRFWVAEHHAVPGIASGSPAVLLAAIGARTEQIRLGSGGVMLPNHRPLVVAEQFRMLAGLHPGRIDLGLGRSLGFTEPVRHALGRLEASPDAFAQEILELRDHLEGSAALTARPTGSPEVPLFVLATGAGVDTAAALGLPVVIGGPFLDSSELPDRLASYRRRFRPHRGSIPQVLVSVDALIADTDEQARELALPEVWAMARSRSTGVFEALEPVARIRAAPSSDREARRVERGLDAAVAGTAGTVRRRLDELLERTGAQEVLATGVTYDREAQSVSDRELMHLLNG